MAESARLPHSMPLSPGTRLGVYEIHAAIGAGGMGEVYRAHDSRLQRDVALKLLPEAFASDPDRVTRFEREAQLLAALNHPHIGSIYGVEESSAPDRPGQATLCALVLELVEGDTLADRIAAGPLPVDEALTIARQVAEALAAAHEHGIVHRDLKPANIKIRPDGTVKVLDFGLAKAFAADAVATARPALSQSPTLTTPAATIQGVILGTAAYMSPEQARGKPVDRRADVWAFGVVLYEMLTGRRAFEADDVSLTLARVLERDVDLSALPPAVPARVRHVLTLCLTKDPNQRIRDIHDVRLALDGVFDVPQGITSTSLVPTSAWHYRWLAGAAAIVAVASSVAVWALRPAPAQDAPVGRFIHLLPEAEVFTRTGRPMVAISPDGARIVYVASTQLYLRNLNETISRPIQGTDEDPTTPFFSPDGQWVGFYSTMDEELKKIPIGGGTPVTLTKAENPFGASWGEDGSIVFAQAAGILRVPANGGVAEIVAKTGQGQQAHGPELLPDGRTLLFSLTSTSGVARWDEAELVVQPLDGGERKIIWKGGSDARYVPTGHLVYALETTLLALPFDLGRLEATGGPVPVIEDVQRAAAAEFNTASANYGFSRNGSLVYVHDSGGNLLARTLMRVDAMGNATPLSDVRRDYAEPQVSPDGTRLAATVNDPVGGIHIWIADLRTGVASQLTFEATNQRPVWTPDGRTVVFRSTRTGGPALFSQVFDGSRPAELLLESPDNLFPGSISRDGVLAFYKITNKTRRDLWTLSLDTRMESAFLATRADERVPTFSPDGRSIAYVSDESGRDEIYVRPYPSTGGGQRRISDGGAIGGAKWSPRGDAIYYVNPSGVLVSVPIETQPALVPGRAREMFSISSRFRVRTNNQDYEVNPKDGGFVFVSLPGQTADSVNAPRQQIQIVLNWFAELRQRVPLSSR